MMQEKQTQSETGNETVNEYEGIRNAVESQRYSLHKILGRNTNFTLSKESWEMLQEWKQEVDDHVKKVTAYIGGDESVFPSTGHKKDLREMRETLGTEPSKENIILYCIGNCILNKNPRWNSNLSLIFTGLKGGTREVGHFGKGAKGRVDTCLDVAVVVDSLARMCGIDGKVVVSDTGHTYWRQKNEEEEEPNGSIVDPSYGWEDRKGLFISVDDYNERVDSINNQHSVARTKRRPSV